VIRIDVWPRGSALEASRPAVSRRPVSGLDQGEKPNPSGHDAGEGRKIIANQLCLHPGDASADKDVNHKESAINILKGTTFRANSRGVFMLVTRAAACGGHQRRRLPLFHAETICNNSFCKYFV
jgi:hypothetical protein